MAHRTPKPAMTPSQMGSKAAKPFIGTPPEGQAPIMRLPGWVAPPGSSPAWGMSWAEAKTDQVG